jgi:hypothetical protein
VPANLIKTRRWISQRRAESNIILSVDYGLTTVKHSLGELMENVAVVLEPDETTGP